MNDRGTRRVVIGESKLNIGTPKQWQSQTENMAGRRELWYRSARDYYLALGFSALGFWCFART